MVLVSYRRCPRPLSQRTKCGHAYAMLATASAKWPVNVLKPTSSCSVGTCVEATTAAKLAVLGELHHRGQGFQLLGMTADRVEEEVVGTHGHQLFQPIPHLLRRAMNPRGIGSVGVVIHLSEPAVDLRPGHVWTLMHG